MFVFQYIMNILKIDKPKLCLGLFCFVSLSLSLITPVEVSALYWKQLKGEHFIINYTGEEKFAETILNRAEKYYGRIADTLGYPRYSDFWTWNKRVNIFVYPDHTSYTLGTGQAEWADGKADYANMSVSVDATNPKFISSILPHELAHLVFRDFVGFNGKIPLWLDEGFAAVAQEAAYSDMKKDIVKLYNNSALMTLNELMTVNFQKAASKPSFHDVLMKDGSPGYIIFEPANFITVFYVQSASVVDFMIVHFGKAKFSEFCRQLRDGKNIETALNTAYGEGCPDSGALERKWRQYLSGQ